MRNDDFMKRAIELARRGTGLVNPNPLVGCVIVKNGRIVAEGYHERYGGFHAERNALLSCDEDVHGAEMYVTLEPCCHTGKTPPCTDIIIERGIGKVYVGSDDPNPLVAGHGIELLRESGIEVETHVLKDECDALNEIFFYYIKTKMPFVAMKYAMSLDGKIAVYAAAKHTTAMDELDSVSTRRRMRRADDMFKTERIEITGPEANAHVHSLRKKYRAILVGVGTVITDDPMLNYRGVDAKSAGSDDAGGTSDLFLHPGYDPIRIILDSHLRIPLTSKIVKTASTVPTVIACCEDAFEIDSDTSVAETTMSMATKKRLLTEAGARVIILPAERPIDDDDSVILSRKTDCKVSLEALFKKLGESGIDSVLVEGGSKIHSSLFSRPELVNRVYTYISPKLIGKGLPPINSEATPFELIDTKLMILGKDLCLTGRVK